MKIRSLRAIIGVVALFLMGKGAHAQTTPKEIAAGIRARLVEGWPKAGSVHVVYGDDLNTFRVGYEFSTGAWYRDNRIAVLGRDPDGILYDWDPNNGRVKRFEKPHTGLGSSLDELFPGYGLRALLDLHGSLQSITQEPDAGYTLAFTLPRGEREFTIEELPEPELARWGGPEKVMRTVLVRVDSDLMVRSIHVKGLAPWAKEESPAYDVDRSPNSPGGFQLVTRPPTNPEFTVKEFRFNPAERPDAFSIATVTKEAKDRRLAVRERTPIARPDEWAERDAKVTPILGNTSGEQRWSQSLVIAGAIAVGIGVVAWIVRRRMVRA
ncbi:MAG: hypothetical protein HUU18_00905 [Phycisphaerales bacterium]|nr:hypothetical protein [Phycisphaerales bacterium]